ncbi:MAG: NPCBM/NEW2 domain-containing protein [Armatimonadetes bacterium]|nr:NPCBM/NEW2 domain-containing protein [Armatimonadota bacterium]
MRISCLLLLSALPAFCQVRPDANTTFLCTFDRDLRADYALGDWRGSAPPGVSLSPGRFGSAARTSGQGITYNAHQNLSLPEGSLEVWLRPLWINATPPTATVFAFTTDAGDYLNLNVIAGGRFGVAVRTGGQEDWVWRRIDVDASNWDPETWRHVAATWNATSLRLYVDGQPVGNPVDDVQPFEGEATTFRVGGGEMLLDCLRLSNCVRGPEAIAAAALSQPGPPDLLYLSSLPMSATGEVRADGLPDRAHLILPLMVGSRVHARGVGMNSPASAAFDVPDGFTILSGIAGPATFEQSGDVLRLSVTGDGRTLWQSDATAATDLRVDITGVHRLELSAESSANASHAVVWADMILLKPGVDAPPSFSREAQAKDLAIARLKLNSHRFTFDLPPGDELYYLYEHSPLDSVDPAVAPESANPHEIRAFACPGEYEPLGLIVAARRRLEEVRISVQPLTSDAHVIPTSEVDIRWALRGPQRKGYWLKPEESEITSRFLLPCTPFDLAPGSFREILFDIHVPEDTPPGVYVSEISIRPGNAPEKTVGIALRVLPVNLPPTRQHKFGMYYRWNHAPEAEERLRLELRDMRRHGINTMGPALGIEWRKEGDQIRADLEPLRRALTILREEGFSGPIPIQDNLVQLARMIGFSSVGGPANTVVPGLEDDAGLLAAAKSGFDALKLLAADFPEFQLSVTHMDEVFGRDRLPLYIQLAKIVRKTTDLPLYVTLNTRPGSGWEQMMAEADPYIDIRCHHGYTIDLWLKSGHTFEEFGELARRSGDQQWMYYNMRGAYFTPEWVRVVNGYYMWMSPVSLHVPWMYYSFGGDPFDDTDSENYDFGYSVPSPQDGKTPVPTLHMKAFREGIDDLRYLELLESLIEQARIQKPRAAREAQQFLARLRKMMPAIPADLAEVEGESPVLIWFDRNYTGEDYQHLRYGVADHILRLQAALGD